MFPEHKAVGPVIVPGATADVIEVTGTEADAEHPVLLVATTV